MSKQIIANYTYSTTAKTVTLTDFSAVRLDRLQLIVNTTTNAIIYNFADSSVATATVSTNVITLSAAPGSNTDKLQIIYDCLTTDPTYDTPVLPSNAAKETGGNLATIVTNTGNIPAKGSTTSANSTPVVIASDQSAVQVKGNATGSAVPTTAMAVGGSLAGNLTIPTIIAPADSQAAQNGLYTTSAIAVYNGTNFDRLRSAAGASTGTLAMAARTATSGGVTVAKIAAAATTNATSVKASAGQVYGWSLFNTSAATRYLKFYNLAVAPTVGTSTPTFIVPLPAGGGSNIMLGDLGTPFATGIAYSISTGVADTDATATAANDVVGAVYYA